MNLNIASHRKAIFLSILVIEIWGRERFFAVDLFGEPGAKVCILLHMKSKPDLMGFAGSVLAGSLVVVFFLCWI